MGFHEYKRKITEEIQNMNRDILIIMPETADEIGLELVEIQILAVVEHNPGLSQDAVGHVIQYWPWACKYYRGLEAKCMLNNGSITHKGRGILDRCRELQMLV